MAESGLTVYGATPNAVELIDEMGKAIHQSGFFQTDNDAQGKVVAMTCLAKGMDPMSIGQRYHNIKGRLSMKSDAMLAEFRIRGGKHRVIKREADTACLELIDGDQAEQFTFTWQDAQAEPFIYNGKESETLRFIEAGNHAELAKRLKPKYSTPRARMQMLWARVVSDGVRTMMPEVNLGTYTPEEIDDFDGDSRAVPSAAADRPSAPLADTPVSEEIEAEFKPSDAPQLATRQMVHRIKELFLACGVPAETQAAALRQAGADQVERLPFDQANDLISALESKFAQITQPMAGESRADPDAIAETINAPIREQTIGKLRGLMTEMVQMPGMADFAERCNQKLQDAGMTELSDLTEADGQQIIQLFGAKNVEAFFGLDLKVAAGNGS